MIDDDMIMDHMNLDDMAMNFVELKNLLSKLTTGCEIETF